MKYKINIINGQYSAYTYAIIDDLKDFKNQLESSEMFLEIKDSDGDIGIINKNMITSIYKAVEYQH